ncbi:MAG: pilus assembly protein PilM [Candidatus Taylorbacteria bacterium]|nr:pilus assembly protein PilM [Candidatus Taylorbacteria bacterium]
MARTSTFAKFFPAPQFLKVAWVGIDMSDESLRLVELVNSPAGLRLGHFAEKELERGIMKSGQILDKAKLIAVLKELRKLSPTPNINASLPEEKSYLFTADVADGTEEEIRQNIEYILEENVPIPPSETLFEFDIIKRYEHETKVSVSVTATPAKIVEEYTEVFNSSGFTPYSMEVEGRPLARALLPRGEERGKGGTSVIINYNDQNAGIFLVSGGIIWYTSTLSFELKDIPDDFNKEGLVDIHSYIKKEIEKVFAYWHSKDSGQKKIDSLVLSGKNATDEKFINILRGGFSANVEVADVWSNVGGEHKGVPVIDYSESVRFTVAIGLALKGR